MVAADVRFGSPHASAAATACPGNRPWLIHLTNRLTLENIDPHAHVVHARRLLAVGAETVLRVELDQAKVDLVLALKDTDGGVASASPDAAAPSPPDPWWSKDHRWQTRNVSSRSSIILPRAPAVPSGLILVAVADTQPKLGAVAEEGLDEVAQMIDCKNNVGNTRLLHPTQQQLENRHVSERHQRLWEQRRVGMQSRPFAARHDDRLCHVPPHPISDVFRLGSECSRAR